MDGETDGQTERQTDGAGHDNNLRPEWAKDKNVNLSFVIFQTIQNVKS